MKRIFAYFLVLFLLASTAFSGSGLPPGGGVSGGGGGGGGGFVDDDHILWGTGPDQVSLDDVPDGLFVKLGQDASITGTPTFESVILTNGLGISSGGTGATDAAGARANLGIGTLGTQNASSVSITGGSITGITDLAIADGGTGASTAPGARTNLGAAASGANSDITSLSGLTTPLSIGQGGTGANSASSARTNLQAAILGNNSDILSLLGITGAIQAPTQINDSAGNEVLRFGSAPSAVNEITVTNATVGNGPTIAATGGDTDIDLNLLPKGIGSVVIPDAMISGGSISGITDLDVTDGGTGASDPTGARANLGIGDLGTQDPSNVSITGGTITGITDLAVADGGTGASDASGARTNLGAAPLDATFITQTPSSELSNEQALSSISSGIMRVENGTGIVTSLTDSAGIADNISDETGSGALVFGTSPVISTSISQDGDVADAGYLRLQNSAVIGWEASPAGTDVTLTVNSAEVMDCSGTFNAAVLKENNNNVPNVTDHLGVFGLTSSSQLAGVISNETGTAGNLVFSGNPTLNGQVSYTTGAAVTPGAYQIGLDNDATNQLHFNVPTGATFEWSVNDGPEMTLSSSTLNLQNNGLTTTGDGSFSNLNLSNGGALRTGVNAADALLLQARDVDGASYTTFGTLTANNTPTFDLSDAVTKAGNYIYRAGGNDVAIADGGTGTSTAPSDGKLLIGKTDGTYAVANLTAGSNVSITNGNGSITIASSGSPSLNPSAGFEMFDEMMANLSSGSGIWGMIPLESDINGTVAVIQQNNACTGASDTQTVGCLTCQHGTSSGTGRCGFSSGRSAFLFGGGPWTYEMRARIHELSDATDTYTWRHGFLDATDTEPTDGAYFRYTHGTNSGEYQCVTRSNNTETATDSDIAADTNFHKYKVEVNSAGTSVVFSIDGSSVCTNTANIPTGSGRYTGIGASMIKSAGTGQKHISYDYLWLKFVNATPR